MEKSSSQDGNSCGISICKMIKGLFNNANTFFLLYWQGLLNNDVCITHIQKYSVSYMLTIVYAFALNTTYHIIELRYRYEYMYLLVYNITFYIKSSDLLSEWLDIVIQFIGFVLFELELETL